MQIALNKKRLLTILMLGLMLSACGYRFAGSGQFPGGVKRIFIEVFENRTTDIALENVVTDEFIFEFTRQNESTVVSSTGNADAVMTGVIQSVVTWDISPLGTDAARERRVKVTVSVKLTRANGQVVWAAANMSDDEAYPVTDDKTETEENKRAAITVLSERLAERAFNRLTDDF